MQKLHHDTPLRLTQHRVEAAYDPFFAGDNDTVADLQRLLPRKVASRNDLLATTQLIPIVNSHRVDHDTRAAWSQPSPMVLCTEPRRIC